jgi:CheY-like chemotaxis protein
MKDRLFLPFEQEDASTAAYHGGSGLGLSIAKNLVEYMGGSILCESEKGAGTTFTVTLPLKECEGALQKTGGVPGDAQSADGLSKEQGSETGHSETPGSPKDRKPAMTEMAHGRTETTIGSADTATRERDITDFDFTGYKVLLAEDTKMSADILKDMFALCHLTLDWAKNGEEAVEKFGASKKGDYIAILMDVQMPVMDGYTATKTIRAMNRVDASEIPIYAMTANAFEEDIEHAIKCGMTGHLAKPIDILGLCGLLEKLK